jgi:hypothetical protein
LGQIWGQFCKTLIIKPNINKAPNNRSERDKLKKTTAAVLLTLLAISVFCASVTTDAYAKPEDVQILSYSWYTYPASSYSQGAFIVVGEVQNVGITNLDGVRIMGIVYTSDGQPQAESMCQAFVEDMLPQQKAPFYMYFDVNNAYSGNMTWMDRVDHVDLSVVYANDTETQPDTNLIVLGNASYTDPSRNGLYTVTGIIKNNGMQPSKNLVWAVTTFYDSSGTVIGVNQTASPHMKTSLAPNATFAFTATPVDYTLLSGQVATFSILVQSRQIAVASPTPTPTQSANPSPTSTTAITQQPTQPPQGQPSTDSGSSQEWLYALVGAVAGAVAVIVVMVVFRKKK